MKKVALLLADGYEEMEMVTVVDVLRRGGLTVDLLTNQPSLETVGDHGLRIQADKQLSEIQLEDYQAVVTPGGLPGTQGLKADSDVLHFLQSAWQTGKVIASICASPMVLAAAGISQTEVGTCYPGCEAQVGYRRYEDVPVVRQGRLLTAQGPACSLPFALSLLEMLKGEAVRQEVEAAMLLPRVKARVEAKEPLCLQVEV